MKKVIFSIIFIFALIPIVKADLTLKQGDDLATFAENFIVEGNKRLDSNGYPLLTYMQGQARIDGYQSKLYKVTYDYQKINYVNSYKWTFDCASFASFVYYQTFGLVLTKSVSSEKDPYSGLSLRRFGGNPYEVETFVNDAANREHFYLVKKQAYVAELDYSELKKGDLLIEVGHHIMVYVGDGKIAHATTSAISKTNLGLEVIYLKDKFLDKKLNVIRIKDNIIPTNKEANMKIAWLDTGEIVDFNNLNKLDNYPRIAVNKSTEDWTKELTLEIKLTANNGIDAYSFNDDNWIKEEGKSFSFNEKISENGTYTIKIKDKKGLETSKTLEITNIDLNSPLLGSLSTISKDTYSIIVVSASDSESGLDLQPYSFDGGKSWTSKSQYEVSKETEYQICVKDKVGNTDCDKIFVKLKRKSYPEINNIILGNITENKRKVGISVLNCERCELIVKKSGLEPSNNDSWIEIASNYITYLENGTYKVWVRDINKNNISFKEFEVIIDKESNINTGVILTLFSALLIIFGICLSKKYKNSKI